MTLEEKIIKLRNREEEGLDDDTVIELCFELIKDHPKVVEQCRAAAILSGIVQPGLGKRTTEFLQSNQKLPPRVYELLSSAVLRMESF